MGVGKWLAESQRKLAALLIPFNSSLIMGLPDEVGNAYKIVPIALNYYASKLEGIQKSIDNQDNEYGFARQVQSALSEDLTGLIDNLRNIAKEIKTMNDSKNDDWEKVPAIVEKHKGIITLSLVKFRDDLLDAKNLVLDTKLGESVTMPNIKKLLDAIQQTAIFKIDLPNV